MSDSVIYKEEEDDEEGTNHCMGLKVWVREIHKVAKRQEKRLSKRIRHLEVI